MGWEFKGEIHFHLKIIRLFYGKRLYKDQTATRK